jgi:succinate dehydrogenase / fumarate reductase membrane anchor subunit
VSLRHPLARVRGLGSAKTGTDHWRHQRLTAIALIPLSLWFIVGLAGHLGGGHAAIVAWVRTPFVTPLLVLLIVATFYHLQLGVQVVIEDYIHAPALLIASQVSLRLACLFLAATGLFAVLPIAFGIF